MIQGALQKALVLGHCHCLHLNNEEGHFLPFFLLPLHFCDTFYSELRICGLLVWLNNCMGGRGTEAETSDHLMKAMFCLRRAFLFVVLNRDKQTKKEHSE